MTDVRNIVDELRGEYVEHGLHQVEEIGAALDRLQTGGGDADSVREIQRQVHSIKGTAYSFGLPDVSLFAAAWEADVLDAMETGAMDRIADWRRLCGVLGRLFAIARDDAAEMLPDTLPDALPDTLPAWTAALIWTPYASGRKRLSALAEARGANILVARTDRDAVAILARGGVDTIVSDTVTDADLDFEQRARLIGSLAAGLGAGWVVVPGADRDAEAQAHLAAAIRHGARPTGD